MSTEPADRLAGPKPLPAALGFSRGGDVAFRPGNSCPAVAEINTLAALGSLAAPHRLRLGPAIGGLAQLPLFDAGNLPADAVRAHLQAVAPPAPVHVYAVPGHELGGGGLLQKAGQVFSPADVLPPYYNVHLREPAKPMPDNWQGALFKPGADIYEVDVPVAQAIHPNMVYGHFLLEMLPRLHLLSRLRRAGLPFLTALHHQLPEWAKAIIKLYFGRDEIIWYDMHSTRIKSPCFIVPGMMQVAGKFHPQFNLAIDEIKDFLTPGMAASAHRKIWLSRKGHAGLHGIRNEDAVEDVMLSLGYHIVQPQKLSFAEQIALMQGAQIVAGAYGSAIHNSMFAKRGTKVFCVNRLNHYQSGIGALRSQPMGYFPPDAGSFRDAPVQGVAQSWYEVDCAALRDTLLRFETWRPA